ncbi:MAG: hypothetical protein A2Z99_17100 [Treponema sp. GWB1_62_6]|nr:MAG: hypothetical protein A2Y36_09140 [Treponema sp. GWA1_62_8]OHE65368.1 MAG: hypothetical protein A2001_00140 [Treponema sp. GWC1_61_84]OHE70331.1 MAG: hypothetical protein A2Z99_17100 [Treponema sp. GWB1_62_6]HCM25319.1 hypothetical protein [Treponema sp.]
MAIVKKRSSSKQIIDYILDRIEKRELHSGDQLPNERDFAEMLGVSRVPLREAISALSMLGILEARQGEGTFVNRYDPSILGKIIYTYTILDNTSMDEIMEARKMMEAYAAKLATANATAGDLAEIKDAMEKRDKELDRYKAGAGDGESLYENDNHFHNAIAKATHNRFCIQFLDAIRRSVWEQQRTGLMQREMGLFDAASDYHHRIFQEISARNAGEAYRIMFEHIESVQLSLREQQKKEG